MKNRAKYLVCLFYLLLMAVLTTTSKNEGDALLQPSKVVAFEAGNFSMNSSAEITALNYGSLFNNVSTSSRRITRTTKAPSHPMFGDAVLMCGDSCKPNFPNTNTNNILISNNISSKDYIYILCCIRI